MNDMPEFDYESHMMSNGKKILYVLIALAFSLGFGFLWYAIAVGGMGGRGCR